MGIMKHMLEGAVERKCTCDGGISLDVNDHNEDCPARKYLEEQGHGA